MLLNAPIRVCSLPDLFRHCSPTRRIEGDEDAARAAGSAEGEIAGRAAAGHFVGVDSKDGQGMRAGEYGFPDVMAWLCQLAMRRGDALQDQDKPSKEAASGDRAALARQAKEEDSTDVDAGKLGAAGERNGDEDMRNDEQVLGQLQPVELEPGGVGVAAADGGDGSPHAPECSWQQVYSLYLWRARVLRRMYVYQYEYVMCRHVCVCVCVCSYVHMFTCRACMHVYVCACACVPSNA